MCCGRNPIEKVTMIIFKWIWSESIFAPIWPMILLLGVYNFINYSRYLKNAHGSESHQEVYLSKFSIILRDIPGNWSHGFQKACFSDPIFPPWLAFSSSLSDSYSKWSTVLGISRNQDVGSSSKSHPGLTCHAWSDLRSHRTAPVLTKRVLGQSHCPLGKDSIDLHSPAHKPSPVPVNIHLCFQNSNLLLCSTSSGYRKVLNSFQVNVLFRSRSAALTLSLVTWQLPYKGVITTTILEPVGDS